MRLCLEIGGDDGNRTHDPLLAGQVLSQLSYTPSVGLPPISHRSFSRIVPYLLYGHDPRKPNNKSSLPTCFRALPSSSSLSFGKSVKTCLVLHRKEVIQPHLPIRLPCYDLTPIIRPTFDCCPLAVSSQASGVSDFHGLTGGVYKARERIHRGMLIRDY